MALWWVAALIAPVAQHTLAQDTEEAPETLLTDADRAWLRAHPVIRVGAETQYAPYELRDGRGQFAGVVADYLDLIRTRINVDVPIRFEVVQLTDFNIIEDKLRAGKLDMVMALTPTPVREQFLAFTKPYLHYVNVIVTRDTHPFVTGLADFTESRVAVVKGHSGQQLVTRAYPDLSITQYDNILEALVAVSTGGADGLVDDIFPITYNIRSHQIGNLKLATPLEKGLQGKGFSMAVRRDWPQLRDVFDRLIDTITEAEQRTISEKWLSLRYESKVDWRPLMIGGAFFTVLLLLALLWIGQLKRQRGALEAARRQAEAANRAKDGFLAAMSHELRTPLHAILGYADLMRQRQIVGTARQDALDTIASSGRHLLALINDLLDLSRVRGGHLELRPATVRLKNFLDDIAAMTRLEATRKGLEFVLWQAPTLPAAVEVDDRRLRQVLLNLLNNAIKFTDRGNIKLAVDALPATPGLTQLRFVVEDTGVGIDPRDAERIFAPFEQAEAGRKSESGVGLGLAISREIVERMHGQLEVRSRPERGSRFEVLLTLPVRAEVGAEITRAHQIAGYDGERKHILVVDDNVQNRQLIAHALTPLGFDVTLAQSGDEALHLASEARPDLVVMDLRMPRMDGFACAQALRATLPETQLPMIAASASSEDLARAEQEAMLFQRQLRKPFDANELIEAIGSLLRLRWQAARPPSPASDAAEAVIAPAADILAELRHCARVARWVRIEEIAREMQSQDTRHTSFATRVLAFAHEFDEEGLARYIEEAENQVTSRVPA